jgi:hypothetical protein
MISCEVQLGVEPVEFARRDEREDVAGSPGVVVGANSQAPRPTATALNSRSAELFSMRSHRSSRKRRSASSERTEYPSISAKVPTMRELLEAIVGAVLAAPSPRASLIAENLALRQQLAVLRLQTSRPRLRPVDRAFWAVLSRVWSRWADALAIVRPATVIAWHRRGLARFWACKSRRPERPPIGREVVELIERMATENPMWSRRRIAAELAKLGHDVSKDTVVRYMPTAPRRPGRPPSTAWARSFACTSPGLSRSTF